MENCSPCGEHFGKIHADDSPTIIIVGGGAVDMICRDSLSLASLGEYNSLAPALTLAILPKQS